MSLPFRNTDKFLLYPDNHVTTVIENEADAEAAVRALDEAGFGEKMWYARGEEAVKLIDVNGRQHGPFALLYRTIQHLTDEHDIMTRYEKKVLEGASFLSVHLKNPKDKRQVGDILKAHGAYYLHFLGHGTYKSLA